MRLTQPWGVRNFKTNFKDGRPAMRSRAIKTRVHMRGGYGF